MTKSSQKMSDWGLVSLGNRLQMGRCLGDHFPFAEVGSLRAHLLLELHDMLNLTCFEL